MNDVLSAISARHCKRAFLDRPVPRELLEAILSAAANAPSSRNTQPWQVVVVAGEARRELSRLLCAEFDAGVPLDPDYLNSPAELHGVHAERAQACAAETFAAKGIERTDAASRRAHLLDNMRFYGAPIEMIFHLAADAVPGSFLALGCYLQNVMLGLVSNGLGSCPQYSVAGYSATVKGYLGLPPEQIVVCGLAVGYPDPEARVNGFFPERARLEEFVSWVGRPSRSRRRAR